MAPRVQRRIQRYGWDLAAEDYDRNWHAQLAGVQADLVVSGGEYESGDCEDGLLGAAASLDAQELGTQVAGLCKAVPQRATRELEYLQAKWAAHLPYRQAIELLREPKPFEGDQVRESFSFG